MVANSLLVSLEALLLVLGIAPLSHGLNKMASPYVHRSRQTIGNFASAVDAIL
jgi:hypothetical protein